MRAETREAKQRLMVSNTLADNVRTRRLAQNLTQAELQGRIKGRAGVVSKVESSPYLVSVADVIDIAAALRVMVSDLFQPVPEHFRKVSLE